MTENNLKNVILDYQQLPPSPLLYLTRVKKNLVILLIIYSQHLFSRVIGVDIVHGCVNL